MRPWRRVDTAGLVVLALLCLGWVESIGLNGHVIQHHDFIVRNAIYETLVREPWPIAGAGGSYFSYYLAFWLVPAGLSKLLPGVGAELWLYGWAYVGVLLGMWWERVHIIVCRSEWHTAASYAPSGVDVAMLCGGLGLFLALFLALSARMPREQVCPAAAAALPGRHHPGRAALLGATVGLLLPGVWYAATQWVDTAGVVSARPLGYPFIVPPLLVCALLGAGLALALLFYFHLRKHS
jgi:predicted secreted protein